ncbi:hypothetical protein BGAL_0208g00190 [Botrytis galanthina]|uniref:Uncharacterized protein n=1 Tax=Botrytis galanthina TaxID=278940 RepID=A0A4S8QVA6_9HELO|nr:hypothetical protein BGAL_0208g00190 [Botrytis galanthina]
MSRGPKVNENYLYPNVADQLPPRSNPPMNNSFPASSPIVNAPARQYNQNFPHPSMNRQSSSAYPPTHVACPTSAYTSTGNFSAPKYNHNFPYPSLPLQRSSAYIPSFTSSTYASASASAGKYAAKSYVPAATCSNPTQTTHRRKPGSSSRHSQASCSSDTCFQPSLPPSPKPFNREPIHKSLSQLQNDIPVRPTAQDTKRDSGRSDRSTSGLSSPAPTSVGSSSPNKGRPRINGVYVDDYDRPKRRHRVSRETRKKETAERQAVARLSAGRQTAKSPAADGERE